MPHAWLPGDPGEDELENLFAGQREAWRGDVHLDDEPWRGVAHLADWPEASAGPEYWMYKRAAEE